DSVELISATIPEADKPTFSVADVAALSGSVARGQERFNAFCSSCHRVGNDGVEYAPNLTGWAKRQTAEVFFNSVINPSADIASGFGGTVVKTKDGTEIHGVVVSEGDPIVIQSAAGLVQSVPRNRITERKGLGRSLMMSADQLGLKAQDLADIHAFLKTR
ncbi:MAG: c-type cytochrome, partial [Verrucomicrobiota bacterium]